jgi:hypothetical protein
MLSINLNVQRPNLRNWTKPFQQQSSMYSELQTRQWTVNRCIYNDRISGHYPSFCIYLKRRFKYFSLVKKTLLSLAHLIEPVPTVTGCDIGTWFTLECGIFWMQIVILTTVVNWPEQAHVNWATLWNRARLEEPTVVQTV